MKPIAIMVNGLPGNMATLVAQRVLADDRFTLIRQSLTGPEIRQKTAAAGGEEIGLIPPGERQPAVETILRDRDGLICVDYTHPAAANENAEFYCRNRLPFVMGTTGGDRDRLEACVRESGISAVIAPNMGKQIVGFQAMMAYAAETFPGLFNGYSLAIRESHQQGKADTSGTAKAVAGYFTLLGVPFSVEEIVQERDPAVQREQWKIPERHLGGHGWHTYTLVSRDGTVRFEFTHNVNGRDIYVDGTVDAVLYLARKMRNGTRGRVFSMIDVLKGS